MITNILAVGAGGFLGAVARYVMSFLLLRAPHGALVPYGTFAANMLGCLGIGIVGGLVEAHGLFRPELRLFLLTGLLGGLTTFSTFGWESVQLLRGQAPWLGALNILLHVAVGLTAVVLGMWRAPWGDAPRSRPTP